MRILYIRFKNLNSLVGEWEIDLSHPAFTSNGIFAITGPTGAGKTTILDAICLALYGRTPRLSKITKSDNEIMSRHTGECFAEVIFETSSGRYRCHWSQHRARKKSDGELQAPKHEISDAVTGKIFETKIRGVAEQIESISGIDFDRFTRSMLLAQGGFAAFLQADPDERAPILEQITGTEIYSQISIRVHQHCTEERKKLAYLRSELAAVNLLSEDEEKQYNSLLEQISLKETELNARCTDLRDAINWKEKIGSIEKDLLSLSERKRDLETRIENFRPKSEKLELATRALELSAEYAALQALRSEQNTDRQSWNKFKSELPGLESKVEKAQQAIKELAAFLETQRSTQKEVALVIRKVRELDLKIQEKKDSITALSDTFSKMEKSLETQQDKNLKDSVTLAESKSNLEIVNKLLSETSSHERLIENLAWISKSIEQIGELDKNQNKKKREIDVAQKDLTKLDSQWRELEKYQKKLQKDLQLMKEMFSGKEAELKKILDSRDLVSWRDELTQIREKEYLLEKLNESVKLIKDSREKLCKLNSRRSSLVSEEKDLQEQISRKVVESGSLEKEIKSLETQLSLLNRIRDLEEARCQLRDGEPCPLCGSMHHPYAQGNIPQPDQTRIMLDKVRDSFKSVNEEISRIRITLAERQKELEHIDAECSELNEKIVNENAGIDEKLSGLSLQRSEDDITETLERLRKENETGKSRASNVVNTAEKLEKEIEKLRYSLDKTREQLMESERKAQAAVQNKKQSEQKIIQLIKDYDTHVTQLRKVSDDTLVEIRHYGIDQLPMTNLNRIISDLTEFRNQWTRRQEEKTALEKKVSLLEVQINHQNEKINELKFEIEGHLIRLGVLKNDQDKLINERAALFGQKDADTEEASMTDAVAAAEGQLENARQHLASITEECSRMKAKIEAIEKQMVSRDAQIKTAVESFLSSINAAGFEDEQKYRDACLPEDQRKELMKQAQSLGNEQMEIDAKIQEKTVTMEKERQKMITDQSLEQLHLDLEKAEKELKGVQQQIGAIRQKLTDNCEQKKRQSQKLLDIGLQEKECSRWDKLHELIGSADGKKYRNFAQGLTFEMMIGYANVQLQKMSDRYLLIRDNSEPLELNVIDSYQAGEIRSTKNLSGGESFIVSLSLALGLSQMASKNVRVDSLFLDEGFGTLDEDALETALETLSGLYQRGKMIGVISHVQALKERIGTQIEIVPQTGGKSVINGPGCRRVESGVV